MTAPAVTYYVIRQARTRIIGSRVMTRFEADREVRAWSKDVGPARAVPVTRALRQAVRAYDQDTLREALYGTGAS